MPEAPQDGFAVFEIPVPVQARIHRARRQSPETAILVVRAPGRLPALRGEDAPVAATLGFCPPRPSRYWDLHARSDALAWVRHDGRRFWRPLAAPKPWGPVRPESLGERVAAWGAGDEEWPDWPYACRKLGPGLGRSRLPLVEAEGLALRSCSVNPAASHADEVRRIGEGLCVIDGDLHASCGEPALDVVLLGLSKGKPTLVAVVPGAGPQLDARVEPDVVQTFEAAAAGAALAYAGALAAATGLRLHSDASWTVARPVMRRCDARDAPAEGLSRIAARTHRMVGKLPRQAADAWLDLRDGASGPVDGPGAARLVRRLRDRLPEPGGAVGSLLSWELLRWDPGACDGPGMPAADMEALEALA